MTDVLLQRREGFVLVLTLNRPEARNALSPQLIGALSNSLKAAADDEGVRVVVITGTGEKAFCAGMDLKAFSEARDSGGGVGSFDALTWFHKGGFPKPVVAAVNGQAEVLMDGGVRRGSDIVKAICLGARAVLVGRAYAFGLAAAGKPGVTRALEILRQDVERTLRLLGCSSVSALNSSYLNIPKHW